MMTLPALGNATALSGKTFPVVWRHFLRNAAPSVRTRLLAMHGFHDMQD